MKIPVPKNEKERLSRLSTYHIVEAEQDARLDELTTLAASIFDVPMAIITILDQSRQWFKSKYGLELKETARDISFCQYTIMEEDIFEVPDTYHDQRFKTNPLVQQAPFIRYYCGAPLISKEGFSLGSLGLIDSKPRQLDKNQHRTLQLLAQQVVDHFELHRDKIELEQKQRELEATVQKRNLEIQQKLDELSRKDERLDVLGEELSMFMYKASHDLRGPLKTLMGLIQLALKESGEEQVRTYLQLLKSTQEKLDNTLNHLLKIVQVQNHEAVLEEVQLEQLLQASFRKVSNDFKGRQVEFACRLNKVTEIKSDPFLLETALEQILKNSIQHNNLDKPSINIKVEDQAKKIRIDIEDNGPGISEEEKDHLFKMFYKNRSAGSGLGLYMVKTAVEHLKGAVFCTSEKRQGSIFTILLPG